MTVLSLVLKGYACKLEYQIHFDTEFSNLSFRTHVGDEDEF